MSDLISRQAAISAIQQEYADTEGGDDKCAVWKNVGLTNALHIMQDLPSAEPDTPMRGSKSAETAGNITDRTTGDCISRQAAIEWCLEGLNNMPSAEPERTGHWIECYPDGFWKCSSCNFVSEAFAADVLYHYCPNCGARMEEVEHEL